MEIEMQGTSNSDNFEMRMRLERMFPPGCNIYIKVVAYLEESVEFSEFNEAVMKLAYKHPLLRSRYKTEDDEWFFTTEGGAFPETRVVKGSKDQIIRDTITEENRNPVVFDGEHPTSRFILFKGDSHDAILAYVHHSIADGRAVAFLMKHLLEFIANPDKEVDPLTPISLLDAFPDDIKPSRFMRLMMRVLRRKWEKEKITFTAEEICTASKTYSQNSPELYIPVKLSKEETSKLRERARREGCTVNSAILAALASIRRGLEDIQDKPDTIAMAVDARRFLKFDVGEACSMLATGISIKLDDNSFSDFWTLAREISLKTEEELSQPKRMLKQRAALDLMDPTFNDGQIMMTISGWQGTPLLRKAIAKSKSRMGILLTNLGGFEIPDFYEGTNPLQISDVEFIMPIQSNEMLSVAAASLDGKLTLIFPNRPKNFDEQTQQRLAEQTISILRSEI